MSLLDHLEKLRILESVCRLGSFSEAAAELGITQPAVSRAVKKLEDTVGSSLITRSRQGNLTTRKGHELFKLSREIFASVEKFENANGNSPRPLRIGTKEPIAMHLLAEFIVSRPSSRVELLIERTNSELVRRLSAGEVDVIVVPESKFPKDVKRIVILKSRWSLFEGVKCMSNRLIVFAGTLVGKGKLSDELAIPADAIKVESLETVMSLSIKGLGRAVLPLWMAQKSLRKGELVEISDTKVAQLPPISISILHKAGESKNHPELQHLKKWCLNENTSRF